MTTTKDPDPREERIAELLETLERDRDSTKVQLVAEIRALARRLTERAAEIERGSMPNSLGEVQGRASEIDRLCALFVKVADLAHTAELLTRVTR